MRIAIFPAGHPARLERALPGTGAPGYSAGHHGVAADVAHVIKDNDK